MKVLGTVARASRGLLAAALFLAALMIMHPGLASATSLTAAPGQSVRVSATLNPGETISGANVMFFASSSAGVYTGLHASTVANFTAGQSTTVSETFALPATLAVGNYYISAEIYSSSWAPLHWIQNFATLTVATVASAPAATGATTTVSSPSPVPGGQVNVSANLTLTQNLSGANVSFFVANSSGVYTGLHTNTVINFTNGQSKTVSATLSLPATIAAGTYKVSVGVYSSSWATLRWAPNVSTFTVGTATVATASQVTTPTTISGTPVTALNAGSAYSFTPTAKRASGASLTFSIANQPVWAKFDTTSGALTGTPAAGDVGSYANIVISVSDGKTSASLPPFTLTVTQISNGVAALQWTPPTDNTDGSVLADPAGYKIYYGTSASALTQTVAITNPGLTAYTLSNLSPGTWYFVMTSQSAAGLESPLSGVISATL